MKTESGKGSDMISDAQLATRLKCLVEIEPPKGLRDRLVATIPSVTARRIGRQVGWLRFSAAKWVGGSVAAAIVLVAVVWLSRLTTPSISSVTDINDRSAAVSTTDMNFPDADRNGIFDNNSL